MRSSGYMVGVLYIDKVYYRAHRRSLGMVSGKLVLFTDVGSTNFMNLRDVLTIGVFSQIVKSIMLVSVME